MKKYLLQIDLSAEQEGAVSFLCDLEIIAAQARLAALRGMYYVYDISSLGVVNLYAVLQISSPVFLTL